MRSFLHNLHRMQSINGWRWREFRWQFHWSLHLAMFAACTVMSGERYDVPNHRQINCLFNSLLEINYKENTNGPHHWSLWGESTGYRWTPKCYNITHTCRVNKTPGMICVHSYTFTSDAIHQCCLPWVAVRVHNKYTKWRAVNFSVHPSIFMAGNFPNHFSLCHIMLNKSQPMKEDDTW